MTKDIILDTQAPRFKDNRVKIDTTLTNKKNVKVFGDIDPLATGELGEVTLKINGNRVALMHDGSFNVQVPLNLEGENLISVTIEDKAGNTRTETLSVIRDTLPPTITVDKLPGNDVDEALFTFSGTVSGTERNVVWVNGERTNTLDGVFTKNFLLNPGTNIIVVQAEDEAGNRAEERITVTYNQVVTPNVVSSPAETPAPPVSPLAYVLMIILLIAGIVLGLVAGITGAKFASKGEDEEGDTEEEIDKEIPDDEISEDAQMDDMLEDTQTDETSKETTDDTEVTPQEPVPEESGEIPPPPGE
ncbi:MAG TPA: hypothetical protein ENN76_01430 [Euryarchaeota archaeon]|nr:hypothetical protein [Euryarchaeota archaeon]